MFFEKRWVIIVCIVFFLVCFSSSIYYAISKDGTGYVIKLMAERSFPFENIILEGIPGLAKPQIEKAVSLRQKAAGIGMYLLTGVNISDARTYFLGYFAQPKDGPYWVGWAYNPQDPEMEGTNIEPIGDYVPIEPLPAKTDQDILVGIYHTHNSENYIGDDPGKDDHADNQGDIVSIGKALTEALNRKGVGTVQNTDINDKEFMSAYSRSINSAQELLKENPTIRILIDLHRDGLPPEVGKAVVKVGDKDMAKILFVVGKKNNHWEKNNQLVEKIISIGNQKYPGLFSENPSYAIEARYNQHLSNGAILLEIGSQLNTPQEALNSVGPIAEVLKECLQ